MPKLEPILEKLARAQERLLRTADAIPSNQWKTSPGNGAWSAAEVVAHLIMVERAIIASADRIVQKTPRRVAVLKRLHLPTALLEARLIRRKTPIPVDPELVREKEAMLAAMRHVRERTLAFLEETKGRDLSAYRWPHPFLGSLNTYGWFQTIALHQLRHEKQMRKIVTHLPKDVATLQK